MHITDTSSATPRSGSSCSRRSKRRASKYIRDLARKEFAGYKTQAEHMERHMVTFNEVFIKTMKREAKDDRHASAEAHNRNFKM